MIFEARNNSITNSVKKYRTEIDEFEDELELPDHIVSCIYCFKRIDTELEEFDVSGDGWAICPSHNEEE